jgi:hypothetical protein
MPLFKILATDHSYVSAEINADHAAFVFHKVQRLDCKEADVLVNDAYSFSIRLGENGFWSIFQRDHDAGWGGRSGTRLARCTYRYVTTCGAYADNLLDENGASPTCEVTAREAALGLVRRIIAAEVKAHGRMDLRPSLTVLHSNCEVFRIAFADVVRVSA